MNIVVRKLKLSDFFKLHKSYDSLGSRKYFIDLYWLGFERLSIKWFGAQILLFGSTIPLFRKFLYLIFPYGVFLSIVATIDDEIVGHDFLIYRKKLKDGDYMVEHGIWVTEKSRGMGIGKNIMRTAFDFASEEGNVTEIMLWVWANNDRALNMYKSFDLHTTKILKGDKEYNGEKFDAIQMVTDIKKKDEKKALFIATGIDAKNPGITGGETRFIEVAKGWRNAGYDIHLLSTKGGPHVCSQFSLDVTLHDTGLDSSGRKGFLVRFLHSFSLPKTLKSFKKGIVYSSNEQLYDVLPGLILKIRSFKRIKWAVVTHWLPPYKWWTRKESTFLNSLLFLISERISLYIACLFADKILAVSSSTKKQIERDFFAKYFIKKVKAVECGVNYSEIREISKKVITKKYDAVFMKRIQSVKGAFDLIDIWKKVVDKLPKAHLLVIGTGIDIKEVKEKVRRYKLVKNITFAGPVFEFDKKVKKLSQAKLFVLPSYEENWAIVIGESMACGVPVLAYGLKELKNVWKKSFLPIPVGDTNYFGDCIISLLKDDKKRQELSDRGLFFVKRYDWDSISKKELGIIIRS